MFTKTPSPRWRESGLTMIELIIFMVIVGVAVAGVLLVMNLTTSCSAEPQLRKQALAIAESLMEEVQLARFTFCDPADANAETAAGAFVGANGCAATVENVNQEAGNTRPFDNVNDYVTTYGTPVAYANDANGVAFPAGYAASVTILPEALNGIASNATPLTTNSLRIRVVVTFGNDNVTLDGYRTRYDPNAVP